MRKFILVFLLLTSSILARDLLAIASNNTLSDSSSKRLSDSELSEVVGGRLDFSRYIRYTTYLSGGKKFAFTSIYELKPQGDRYMQTFIRNLVSSSNEYAAIYYNYNYQTRSEYVNLVVFNPYYKSIRTINMPNHPDVKAIFNSLDSFNMSQLRTGR
ncbi:hypothetical protein [Campylobacter avium]|uniref:hypothetical protein n=2 Tax=Campylobacter avium TaxID=522485 RepID=UPI002355329F|nr:hypothetical protein [Campylobacter avium]